MQRNIQGDISLPIENMVDKLTKNDRENFENEESLVMFNLALKNVFAKKKKITLKGIRYP